jgi:transcriptional regulator with XRE-family HTH domain
VLLFSYKCGIIDIRKLERSFFTMNTLSEYLKEKRASRDLSIRKLAEEAGISHTEVKRIEDGVRRQPSPDVLRKIAAALSAPYEEVMAAAGYIENQPQRVAAAGLTDTDDLSENELAEVNNFIAFLKNKREQ